MIQYLDSLTAELQQWAKEYWAEGKVIERPIAAQQIHRDGSSFYRRASKARIKLQKNSWRHLLGGLMVAEDPQGYLEDNKPYGHSKARIEINVASEEYEETK